MIISDLNYLEELSDKELTVQAGVGISTSYLTTTLSQQGCINRAITTLRGTGWLNISSGSTSVTGLYDADIAQIVCVTSNDLVYFNVLAPSGATAELYVSQLTTTF